jgi:hypothetical protein
MHGLATPEGRGEFFSFPSDGLPGLQNRLAPPALGPPVGGLPDFEPMGREKTLLSPLPFQSMHGRALFKTRKSLSLTKS